MQVEITGEAEHVVHEKIEKGQFPSAEAVVEEAILSWSSRGNGAESLSSRESRHTTRTTQEILAEFPDVWPDDESVDEFLQWRQEMRERDLHRQERMRQELGN